MSKLFKTSLILVGVAVLILLCSFLKPSSSVAQTSGTTLTGYAWADNIGWIDFNASTTNGGISVDGLGNLSGYAWSDNVGWIKFGGLSGFPVGSGTVSQNALIVSNKLIGWARVCGGMYNNSLNQTTPDNSCSGNSRTDGWDGWISLSGSNYGVTLSGNTFSGYAWGSDVVGWINFSPSNGGVKLLTPKPHTNLRVEVPAVEWDATDATTCSLKENGTEISTSTSGTIVDYTLQTGVSFTLDCTGPGGETSQDTTSTLPAVPSVCTISQPSNAPGDTNMYVNRTTVWKITNASGTPVSTLWSGTDIGTPIGPLTGGELDKIYTTVGTKTINAATTIKVNATTTFDSYCSTTTLMKLSQGTGGEI